MSAAPCVYVALRADGLRKLGSTRHIEARMYQLRYAAGCGVQLERTWRPADARWVEKVCHHIMLPLRAFPGTIYNSEVYRATMEEMAAAIESAIQMVETGTAPVPLRKPKKPAGWRKILAAEMMAR